MKFQMGGREVTSQGSSKPQNYASSTMAPKDKSCGSLKILFLKKMYNLLDLDSQVMISIHTFNYIIEYTNDMLLYKYMFIYL